MVINSSPYPGNVKCSLGVVEIKRNGPEIRFVQDPDLLILQHLPVLAPDYPVTVIEIQCPTEPMHQHGCGMVVFNRNNLWAPVTPAMTDLSTEPTPFGSKYGK